VTVLGLSLAVAVAALALPCCVVWSRWWVRDRRRRRRRLAQRQVQAAIVEARMRRARMTVSSGRGLGDPAVTGSAHDAAVGHAGELVGRGQDEDEQAPLVIDREWLWRG
jgi:hypothetical protein